MTTTATYKPDLIIAAAAATIRAAETTLDGVEIIEAQSPGLGWYTLALMDDGDLPTLPRPVHA
jgi:hypothetical protein